MQVQRTLKRREGVWGIVKGDKGGASQVAPPVPLDEINHVWNLQVILLFVIASEHNVRAWQSTVSSIQRRLIASAIASQ